MVLVNISLHWWSKLTQDSIVPVLPWLVSKCLEMDLTMRHGAILATSAVTHALALQAWSQHKWVYTLHSTCHSIGNYLSWSVICRTWRPVMYVSVYVVVFLLTDGCCWCFLMCMLWYCCWQLVVAGVCRCVCCCIVVDNWLLLVL